MPNCAVLNCQNSTKIVGREKGNVSFHMFPSEPQIKEKWIEATGNNNNWFPTKYSRICSVHFPDDYFIETNKLRRLSKEAIPTINVLKTTVSDEDKDQQHKAKEHSPCNTTKKSKLEQDIHQPSNEETPSNTPEKRKLAHRLIRAQQIIKQKNKDIKKLRERNRRKDLKIRNLVTLLECLKPCQSQHNRQNN